MSAAGDPRLAALARWLDGGLGRPLERIEVASADASFRRYFRVHERGGGPTLIAMDAPPDKEDIDPYLRVAALLERCGVHVPHVHALDRAQGFVLLEDLGTEPYLGALRAGAERVEGLYGDAFDALVRIQVEGRELARELPPYDEAALQREMALMPEWFCARHLGLELDASARSLLETSFAWLTREALAQPRVFVHRDFHSRNLMVLGRGNPGIIDFQDALEGPVGYDLVSLLKDCYIAWPRERVEAWVRGYRARLLRAGGAALAGSSEREFLRWFDLIGVQRHVKVLGIFARLWYRDGKIGYLADLPLTLDYVRDACARHAELGELARWIEAQIAPALPGANARARAARSP